MGFAVRIALAVRLVVLLVVRDEVTQREAIVGGDEVHAREGPPRVVLIQGGAARETRCKLSHGGRLAAPVVTHGVSVATVPFRPQGREVADLVAALADVPRFGDQLDPAYHGVLLDDVEEGG